MNYKLFKIDVNKLEMKISIKNSNKLVRVSFNEKEIMEKALKDY